MKIRLSLIISTLALFLVLPLGVKAATNITVDFGVGFPISENNIAPGQVFERTFTVTNNTSDTQSLMIYLNDQVGIWHTGSFDIEDMMMVQIQKPDSSFSTMPNGSNQELLKDIYAFDKSFVFDSLSGPSGNIKKYKLIFTFDPQAGNEYQEKKTVFDVSVGIDAVEEENDDGDGGGDGHHHNNRHGNGNNNGPGGLVGAVFGQGGQAAGASGENSLNQPEVKGEETTNGDILGEAASRCQGWPKWVWILALGIFALVSLVDAGKNYKKEKYGWKWALIWTIAAAIFWYFGDICREFQWFFQYSILLAILVHLIYLSLLRRKLRIKI